MRSRRSARRIDSSRIPPAQSARLTKSTAILASRPFRRQGTLRPLRDTVSHAHLLAQTASACLPDNRAASNETAPSGPASRTQFAVGSIRCPAERPPSPNCDAFARRIARSLNPELTTTTPRLLLPALSPPLPPSPTASASTCL